MSDNVHRLERLESQCAFQESTLEILNQSLIKHELEITKLREQLRLLTEKLKGASIPSVASLAEETPPPHY